MKMVTRQYTPVIRKDRSAMIADERQVSREIRSRFRILDYTISSDETEISVKYFLYVCTEVPEIDRKLDEIMEELFYVPLN